MAAQILASLEDIKGLLPSNADITDNEDAQLQIDAQRLIKGQLSSIFAKATIAGWTTPETTPELIRAVASRFIAARYYAEKFAGSVDEIPAYAQQLYNEAISILTDIRSGRQVVLDENGDPIEAPSTFTSVDFWPNNTTPGPYFEMDKAWS